MTLFENPVAHHVGDIVTIVLNEQTAAQKSAVTTTSKQTTDTLPGSTLIGKAVTIKGNPILNNNIADQTKFDGEGNSQQSNSLTGNITVTVAKVLPNGNLFVKGREIARSQSGQRIRAAVRGDPCDRPVADQYRLILTGRERKDLLCRQGRAGGRQSAKLASRFFNSPWAPF